MKTILSFVFCLALSTSFAQKGTLQESLQIGSTALGKKVAFNIYLPEGYEKSNLRYPVLYLLHGYTDDETGWTQFGQAKNIADKVIENGDAPPMIIVMPDAGVSWYVNSSDGKVNYENFFIQELIPFIDSAYRTRSAKAFRAVAGLSMGGFGTLIMSMKHPEMFAAAAPLSAGILTDDEIVKMPDENWNNVWAAPFGKNLKGNGRLSSHYLKNSILSIVQNGNAVELQKVKYYIDCGDDDFLIKGNMALHAAMIDKKIPHEFRVRDGGHTWTYWRTALPEVLKFVGNAFTR